MILLISDGHIGAPKRYTNMASHAYKALQTCVSANNSESVGHKDVEKLFMYYSFISFRFIGFFHWTVSNLFFCRVTVKMMDISAEKTTSSTSLN